MQGDYTPGLFVLWPRPAILVEFWRLRALVATTGVILAPYHRQNALSAGSIDATARLGTVAKMRAHFAEGDCDDGCARLVS